MVGMIPKSLRWTLILFLFVFILPRNLVGQQPVAPKPPAIGEVLEDMRSHTLFVFQNTYEAPCNYPSSTSQGAVEDYTPEEPMSADGHSSSYETLRSQLDTWRNSALSFRDTDSLLRAYKSFCINSFSSVFPRQALKPKDSLHYRYLMAKLQCMQSAHTSDGVNVSPERTLTARPGLSFLPWGILAALIIFVVASFFSTRPREIIEYLNDKTLKRIDFTPQTYLWIGGTIGFLLILLGLIWAFQGRGENSASVKSRVCNNDMEEEYSEFLIIQKNRCNANFMNYHIPLLAINLDLSPEETESLELLADPDIRNYFDNLSMADTAAMGLDEYFKQKSLQSTYEDLIVRLKFEEFDRSDMAAIESIRKYIPQKISRSLN